MDPPFGSPYSHAPAAGYMGISLPTPPLGSSAMYPDTTMIHPPMIDPLLSDRHAGAHGDIPTSGVPTTGSKRPRSESEATAHARSNEALPIMAVFMADGQRVDLSVLINALNRRIYELETIVRDHETMHTKEVAALTERIAVLEKSPPKNNASQGVGDGTDKAGNKTENAIVTAVKETSLAMIGVAEHYVDGKLKYTLPDPLPEGQQPRQDGDGNRLYNPIFGGDGVKKLAYNIGFMNAVTNQIVQNAKARPEKNQITKLALDDPVTHILPAVHQFFTTCCINYKAQTDDAARLKKDNRTTESRRTGRRKLKFQRRLKMVPVLEKNKNVRGLDCLLAKEWMSDEASVHGNVDEATWNEAANKAKANQRGSKKAYEVIIQKWRSLEVARIYYALDALAYQAGSRVIDPRFHGFEENATQVRPGGNSAKIPRWMLSATWLETPENKQSVVINDSIQLPFKLEGLISDGELDGLDIAAITRWAEGVDPAGTADS